VLSRSKYDKNTQNSNSEKLCLLHSLNPILHIYLLFWYLLGVLIQSIPSICKMSSIAYNLHPLKDILSATSDSTQKADHTLRFIKENRQRVETCDKFKVLLDLSIAHHELYVKLYTIFVYMSRDSKFFDDICRKYNEFAKARIRQKIEEIRLFILGDEVVALDVNYKNKGQPGGRQLWKCHMGAYVQRIQTYICCL
jgi:hypothetical protein